MSADEAGGTGDQDGEGAGAVDLDGVADLFLPAPGGNEVVAAGVDEAQVGLLWKRAHRNIVLVEAKSLWNLP